MKQTRKKYKDGYMGVTDANFEKWFMKLEQTATDGDLK